MALFCLCIVCGCAPKEEINTDTTTKKSYIQDVYKTVSGEYVQPLDTTIGVFTYYDKYSEQATNIVRESIKEYHQLADANNYYVDDSGEIIKNIRYINENGINEYVVVDEKLFDMLKEAKALMKLTDGNFNITLGRTIDLYEDLFEVVGEVHDDPSFIDMNHALACKATVDNIDEIVELNENMRAVRLRSPEGCSSSVKLQIGAFSKGYILSNIAKQLNTLDISYLLDFGSSSINTHYGKKDTKSTWNIGIRSPIENKDYEYVIALEKNYAISTSADDQRYYFTYTNNDKLIRRHHILNPETGLSENYYRGVTVIAAGGESGVLDVLSTALYNIPSTSKRKELVENFNTTYNLTIGYALMEEKEDGTLNIIVNEEMAKHITSVTDEKTTIIVE